MQSHKIEGYTENFSHFQQRNLDPKFLPKNVPAYPIALGLPGSQLSEQTFLYPSGAKHTQNSLGNKTTYEVSSDDRERLTSRKEYIAIRLRQVESDFDACKLALEVENMEDRTVKNPGNMHLRQASFTWNILELGNFPGDSDPKMFRGEKSLLRLKEIISWYRKKISWLQKQIDELPEVIAEKKAVQEETDFKQKIDQQILSDKAWRKSRIESIKL